MSIPVVHEPAKGATHVFPTVPVGAVLQVSPREAERLVATGAFQYVNPPQPASDEPPAKGGRGRKAAEAAGGEQ